MKKVLYISNVEVPYRTEYFNQLSEKIDLTVLYERRKSSNRNRKWSSSIKSNYKVEYLGGLKMFKEYSLDLKIIKYIFSKKYENIILGCYNSPSQIVAIILMRLFKKKYILNIDGEYFINSNTFKDKIKRILIKGAEKYFIAGEYPKRNLEKIVDSERIFVYHFSSLTKKDIENNSKSINENNNNKVLVVGQYLDYKGLDIALDCAKIDQNIKYLFVGSGNRSGLLEAKIKKMNIKNVEVIPFLQKKELYDEYQNCKCVLLPSRKECWGLIINEAASFGCPIISSDGSGAALELLENKWMFPTENYNEIYKRIKLLDKEKYNKQLLIEKNKDYSIERNVKETLSMLKV